MLQEKMNVKCIQILILLLFPIVGSAEPLRIGAIYGLSGPLSSLGQEYANSVRLAEEAAQGKVVITIEDSVWDPKAAVTALFYPVIPSPSWETRQCPNYISRTIQSHLWNSVIFISLAMEPSQAIWRWLDTPT